MRCPRDAESLRWSSPCAERRFRQARQPARNIRAISHAVTLIDINKIHSILVPIRMKFQRHMP